MVAINTKDDLVRLLKEDDELRALLREMVSETVLEVQRDILSVQRETLRNTSDAWGYERDTR